MNTVNENIENIYRHWRLTRHLVYYIMLNYFLKQSRITRKTILFQLSTYNLYYNINTSEIYEFTSQHIQMK